MAIPKDVKINGVKPLTKDEWFTILDACRKGKGIDIELYERAHYLQKKVLKEIKNKRRNEANEVMAEIMHDDIMYHD